LADHPNIFAEDLLGYCELELARWSNNCSRGQKPPTPEFDFSMGGAVHLDPNPIKAPGSAEQGMGL